MSQAALLASGAKTEQQDPDVSAALAEAEAEAVRLAELAAGFELFGVKQPAPERPTLIAEIVEESSGEPSAEAHYRAEAAPLPTAANDLALPAPTPARRSALPRLKPRVLKADPDLAMRLLQATDWAVALFAAEFAARWAAGAGITALPFGHALAFLGSALALKAGLWLTRAYHVKPAQARPEHGASGLALGAIFGLVLANFTAPDSRAAAALAATLPVAAFLLAAVHAAFAIWLRAAHRLGAFSDRIVIVGATEAAEAMIERADKTGEARIVAIVDDRLSRSPEQVRGAPVAGTVDDLLAWDSLPDVDRIVITVTQRAESRVRALIQRLKVVPNRIDLLLDYQTESVHGRRVDRLNGAPLACVSGRPHVAGRAALKRAEDILIGSALLVVFAPVMAVLALLVKLDSKGPAIYRQRRHGFNNRIITVYKFRTMRHAPDAPLRQVQAHDPRVTRIGRILRRTSLDELPQIFNVLRGEMSLVGPRPHAVGMRAAERDLVHIVAEYAHRHRVKPGITGWAQINGSRGPIETPAAVRERVRLDLDYVSRSSLLLDLCILARTAPALLGDRKATR